MPLDHDTHRYHQIVFVWIHDGPKFARYGTLVRPIVEPYDGRLDRQVKPVQFYADGMEQPDVVNLVSSPNRAEFDAFHRDERFREIVHLRSESITMRSASGPSVRGSLLPGDASKRLYVVELAAFGPGGEAAYRAYEAAVEPVMAKYGYHVERVFRPDRMHDLPFEPDLVKVAFFDTPDGMARMHTDPEHERIEKILYPEATRASIWVIGRATAP